MLVIEMEASYDEGTGDFFADMVMQATAIGGYTKIFVNGEINFNEVRHEIDHAIPITDDVFAYIVVQNLTEDLEHELADYVNSQYEEVAHVIN